MVKATSEEFPESDTMVVTLNNIGGLLGRHQFKFQNGVNVLLTRNALGASSLVRGISFAVGSPDVDGGIHQLAKEANAAVKIGTKTWNCELLASEQGVKVGSRASMMTDPYKTYAVIVNEKHPLSTLNNETLKEFLTTIAGADKFREDARRVEQTMAEIRETIRAAKEKKIELEPSHDKYTRLMQKRLNTDLELQGVVEELRAQATPSDSERLKVSEDVKKALAEVEGKFEKVGEEHDEYQVQVDEAQAALNKKLLEKQEDVSLRKLSEAREKKKELAPKSLVAGRGRMLFSSYLTILKEWVKKKGSGRLEGEEKDYLECPFCSKFDNVKCQLPNVPIPARIEVFEEVLHEHRARHKETKGEIEVASQQVHVLESKEVEIDKEIKRTRDYHQEALGRLEDSAATLKNLSGERVRLQRNLMKLVGSLSRQNALDEYRVKLSDLDKQLEDAKNENDKYNAIANELSEYEKRLEKKREEHDAAKRKYEETLNAARVRFNDEATKVMKEVGFKRFTQIQIDEQFNARITRVVDGRDFRERLDQLSTSESTTLTVMLSLAAKQAYCPHVPIFAIDTLTTSLDIGRFPRVIEYAKSKVPFVIATLLSSHQQDEIKVVHTVPE